MIPKEAQKKLDEIREYVAKEKPGSVAIWLENFGESPDYLITWIGIIRTNKIYHRKVISCTELDLAIDHLSIARSFIRDCENSEKVLLKGEKK